MFFWNKRPRWPPSPSVEDELESLSRELHGSTRIADKPGIEGVCARGSIDQYPVIMETLSLTSIVQTDTLGGYGHGSTSSVNSSGPPTPPAESKQPCLFDVGNATQQGAQFRPAPLATPPISRDTSPRGQPRAPAPQPVQNSRPATGHQTLPSQPVNSSSQGSKTQKDSAPALHKANSSPIPLKPSKPSPPVRTSSLPNKPASSIPKRSVPIRPIGPSGTKVQQPTQVIPSPVNATKSPLPMRTSSLANKSSSSVPKPSGGVRPDQPSETKVQHALSASSTPQQAVKQSSPMPTPSLPSKPASVTKESRGVKPDQPARQSTANDKQPLPANPRPQKSTKPRPQVHTSLLPNKSVSSVPKRPASINTGALQPSSAANKAKDHDNNPRPNLGPQGSGTPSAASPKTLSLAERLEEKLRRKHEQRESSGSPDAQKTNQPTPVSVPKPSSPIVAKSDPPTTQEPANPKPRPQLAHRAATVDPLSVQKGPRPVSLVEAPVPKLVPSDEAQSAPILPKRTVSFQTKALKPASLTSLEHTLEQLQSLQVGLPQPVRPPSPSRSGQCLLPCPRSVPVAGYQDWFTIKGMTHLQICPSCLNQMRKSKFRDLLILGTPRPRSERIRCAMSEPWARLAWMQTINKQLDHLHLLCQITQPPPGTKPCTGRVVSEQYWYRVVDPATGVFLPKFNVCSACVRNLRILMPPHQDTFKLCTTLQERVCDFVTDSPRFVRYIDLLDIAANRAEQEHSPQPDLTEFMAYARRKVVLRDCRRSRVALNTWHYMPQLPELTVCEDCYDDVVWPMVKANYSIARKFSAMMRLPPGDGLARCREASCQLYSPRMRLKFREAVEENDLAYLNMIALQRYEAEQRYRKLRGQLLEDEERGYDCDAELRRNLEEWKRWE
ncbi:hypothetical protein BDV27DRAFT_131273 [Aspergillus caelatus]|uniref:Uncharacterized protein n=1 Tax=Aspergillus caelatus TaxID=61420 RepID=A0A5N7A0A5_9EURO|nr:uncharacterized protein BDV27DRAFT_131273 [Aspergillus caelatus]KAE8362609.1 hypothetical protein BDV27DRAFT_131273 [Aspergillus caelatus]